MDSEAATNKEVRDESDVLSLDSISLVESTTVKQSAVEPKLDESIQAQATVIDNEVKEPIDVTISVPEVSLEATKIPLEAAEEIKEVEVKTVEIENTTAVVDEFEKLTVHGNKSLDELQKIQSKRSHLSAGFSSVSLQAEKGISFADPSLKIPVPILESLTLEMRFEKPSEIQASTLPLILDGHNLIAQAQSGAGKTIAFVIGMLAKVDVYSSHLQALCLTPTRELANQIIRDAVLPLASRLPSLSCEPALPGRDIDPNAVCQSQIVVGTPGTVKRWISQGYLRLQGVRVFVLDEADKMVEERSLGADTLLIRNKLSQNVQILFFSATYTKDILAYARKIVPRAYMVTPRSTEELVLDVIFQVRMDVTRCPGGKLQVLKDIYDFMTLQQSIVFVEMRKDADNVARMMQQAGFEISVLHGELTPQDRDRVMEDFRAGRTKVLITTNALARGVDVPAVAVVVNYDLPVQRSGQKTVADEATYLHRIGRCGRFGRRGTAINFLSKPDDAKILMDIEKHYSPEKRMTTEWDPMDIEGLSEAIKERPEGGEIQPSAKTAASNAVNVTIFN